MITRGEGQSVVADAIQCVDNLWFNTSNQASNQVNFLEFIHLIPVQNYVREMDLPSLLCTLHFFNTNIQSDEPAPQEFGCNSGMITNPRIPA